MKITKEKATAKMFVRIVQILLTVVCFLPATQAGPSVEKTSRKSLFDESSLPPASQNNMEELMGLCSGRFMDK